MGFQPAARSGRGIFNLPASSLLAALVLFVPPRAGAIGSQELEQFLAAPARWTAPEFVELWTRDGADAGAAVSHARLKDPPEILGLKPESISATFSGDAVHSVSIVLLDAGNFFGYLNSNLPQGQPLEKAKARFEETFSARKSGALAGLARFGNGLAREANLSPKGGLKLKAGVVPFGNGMARLLSYEHQLLMVSFHRNESEARSILVNPVAAPKKPPGSASALDGFAARGDGASPEKRIKPVPMVVQGNRGYCGVAILAMAGNALGLTPGAEEMAAANGFSLGHETNPDIREMFSQMAREAGVKSQRHPKFEVPLMKASIDQGLPVVVFRYWSEERDYLHSVYSARIARGEKGELPALNSEERRAWPGKGAPAHASIINGYRDDKREIIFTESWGPQARNRRMRYEEMEATCYYAVYFSK